MSESKSQAERREDDVWLLSADGKVSQELEAQLLYGAPYQPELLGAKRSSTAGFALLLHIWSWCAGFLEAGGQTELTHSSEQRGGNSQRPDPAYSQSQAAEAEQQEEDMQLHF